MQFLRGFWRLDVLRGISRIQALSCTSSNSLKFHALISFNVCSITHQKLPFIVLAEAESRRYYPESPLGQGQSSFTPNDLVASNNPYAVTNHLYSSPDLQRLELLVLQVLGIMLSRNGAIIFARHFSKRSRKPVSLNEHPNSALRVNPNQVLLLLYSINPKDAVFNYQKQVRYLLTC